MKQFLKCSAAILAVAAPAVAFAQSTGSQDFEDSIVVTGAVVNQGTVRISVCGRAVDHQAAMALMKRSPKITANCA
ncbi:hypothetical protein, partial [Sphingobium sp.]|uniref:hypothetical protein n=1 Tax=Sphingobium sp. TaxID=1912891 RepID=UPI000DB407E2